MPDYAPLHKRGRKGALVPLLKCKECVKAFRVTNMYRECGFHAANGTFRVRNRGCATLSKLRWILRANGVPVVHDEDRGSVQMYSMGVVMGEDAEERQCRLLGAWWSGRSTTLIMAIVDGFECRPVKMHEAEAILASWGVDFDRNEDMVKQSVWWTQ